MHRETDTETPQLTVRRAGPADSAALVRLAALDSAAIPSGPVLVADIEGELVAALPLEGGRSIADPFQHTSAALEMLQLRAAQVTQARARRRAMSLTGQLGAAAGPIGASTHLR